VEEDLFKITVNSLNKLWNLNKFLQGNKKTHHLVTSW
jgi:hypothetical protein